MSRRDELKGVFGEHPQPKVFAEYSRTPRPALREPRRDSLDRSGEDRTIKYARPSVGKIQRQPDTDGFDYMTRAERDPQ